MITYTINKVGVTDILIRFFNVRQFLDNNKITSSTPEDYVKAALLEIVSRDADMSMKTYTMSSDDLTQIIKVLSTVYYQFHERGDKFATFLEIGQVFFDYTNHVIRSRH